MNKLIKILAIILIILNAMVLLGQIWPQGAPPFARLINIIFLIFNLVYIFWSLYLLKSKKNS